MIPEELKALYKLLGQVEKVKETMELQGVGVNSHGYIEMTISNLRVEIEGIEAALEKQKEDKAEKISLTQFFVSVDRDLQNSEASGVHMNMTVKEYLESVFSRR
jgi:hypothetical protein